MGIRLVANVPRINIFIIEAVSGNTIYVGSGVVLGASAGAEALPRVAGGLSTLLKAAYSMGAQTKIGAHTALSNALKGTTNQVHHILQDAAFGKVIPHAEGICVELSGSIGQAGSQHNIFHKFMESWWNIYRSGSKAGQLPTVKEYLQASAEGYERAGLEAAPIVNLGEAQWFDFGGKLTDLVPRVPDPIPPHFMP